MRVCVRARMCSGEVTQHDAEEMTNYNAQYFLRTYTLPVTVL